MKKNILLSLVLLLAGNLFSGELKVYEALNISDSVAIQFNANPELERAWFEVTLSLDLEDYEDEVKRIKSDKIKYKDGKITIENEFNDVITCAFEKDITARTFPALKKKIIGSIFETDLTNCEFKVEYIEKNRDDGFYVTQREYVRVSLLY